MDNILRLLELAGASEQKLEEYRKKKEDSLATDEDELGDFENEMPGEFHLMDVEEEPVSADAWAGETRSRPRYDHSQEDSFDSLPMFDDISDDILAEPEDDFEKSLSGKKHNIVDVGDDDDLFADFTDDDDLSDLGFNQHKYTEAAKPKVDDDCDVTEDDFDRAIAKKGIVDVGDEDDYLSSDDDLSDLGFGKHQYNESIDINAIRSLIQKTAEGVRHATKQGNNGLADRWAIKLKNELENQGYNWKRDPYALEILGDYLDESQHQYNEAEHDDPLSDIYVGRNGEEKTAEEWLDDIGGIETLLGRKLFGAPTQELIRDHLFQQGITPKVTEAAKPKVEDETEEDDFEKSLSGKKHNIVDVGDDDYNDDYEDKEYVKSLFDDVSDLPTSDITAAVEHLMGTLRGMMYAGDEKQQKADKVLADYGFKGDSFEELQEFLETMNVDELAKLTDAVQSDWVPESSENNGFGEDKNYGSAYTNPFFPNGAEGTAATRSLGPTSAKQSDNPMRNSMMSEEQKQIHEKLVESYKLFLKK